MRPPRQEPPRRRLRRELPRPEGPFDRLLRRKPERDPAPIIIGGTIAFLALVIVLVFAFSSIFGGGGSGASDGGEAVEFAPGVKGKVTDIPGLPPGLVALSDYIEFEVEDENVPIQLGLPLKDKVDDPAGLGFYLFFEGRWQRIAEVERLEREGRVAFGDFTNVPKNIAVLRVVSQTYQVAASLPAGATLHPQGQVNILSTRDYTPASDGSVQGTATTVSAGGNFLQLPTIVGSSEDTASIVNDILADETLRAQHIQAITSLVESGGFNGIDLEYSSVDVDLEPQFTSFVKDLADALHGKDKRLSLTLPPPTNQRLAYNWKELGNAADLIKVLPIGDPITYWEAMPDALGQITDQVDPRKVMLVLSPFSVEDVGDVSRPIGYVAAMALASEAVVREPQDPNEIKPGVTVRLVAKNLDEGEGASPLRWDDDAGTVSFALGGTERRRIFIENSFSFSFKLELVQAYGLGGVAVSDGSAQSDVANVWPSVNELLTSATVGLARPNGNALLPVWQAPEGGDLGAGAGTTATWVAPKQGQYNVVLIVSEGERRFGRKILIEVKQGNEPSPSPFETFPPESPTPTPSPTPVETVTPTPSGAVLVEVGKLADGDDEDATYTNDELVTPGSEVTYLITIDNDSGVAVSVESLVDSEYSDFTCLTTDGDDVIGLELEPDDGDGAGALDGGPDEIQCKFAKAAPEGSGVELTNIITVVVQDKKGNVDTDQDSTKITTS